MQWHILYGICHFRLCTTMSGNKYTQSKLIESIRNTSLSGVIEALDRGADIEQADMHGQPGLPLRTACFVGNLAIIRELIAHGADVNAAGSDGPCAPLRLAIRCRHHGVAALLIKQGAIIPEGLSLNQDILAQVDALDAPPVVFEAPSLPEDSFSASAPPLSPEATTLDLEVDARQADSMGTETRMLTMDLLRFNESDEEHALPERARSDKPQEDLPPAAENSPVLDLELDARPASSFGTETRMLTMDLLRFNDDEADDAPVPERPSTSPDTLNADILEFEPGLYKKTP